MKSVRIPVIAAIPNYNMAPELAVLLPQLLAQGYDRVYVLDDHSRDDSQSVAARFGPKVVFVGRKRNGGAGAARNGMLSLVKSRCYIHFIDADVSLITKNTPEVIRALGIDDTTGFVGGLVRDIDGQQSIWNWGGSRQSLTTMASAWWVSALQQLERFLQEEVSLRRGYNLADRPNPHHKPVRRKVFWVGEANFVIRSDTFMQLGGFDAHIREHDIQPLAIKAAKAGLTNWFDPSFAVQLREAPNVRSYNRAREMWRSERYIIRHYFGLKAWLLHWLPPR